MAHTLIELSVCRRYALRGLRWMDMCKLPPYVDRYALIRLETLAGRRGNGCVMFIFDILSGRVIKLVVSANAPRYHTRASDFLRVDFHRTNHGIHEPFDGAV
jgi:hypothetical protein